MNIKAKGLVGSVFFWLSFISCADIVVTDDVGRKVVLDEPAKKIIALAPHIVENLFSAGAGTKIIGAVEYSDYPEAAKKIQRVGRFDAVSIESILALAPDLVIVWGSGGGLKLVEKLESFGIKVYVDEPSSLDSIAKSIRHFAVLSGTKPQGELAAKNFTAALQEFKKNTSEKVELTVFYQLWSSPIQTVGGVHLISDAISVCGGDNIFSEAKSIAPKINIESILDKNPEVIIASGVNSDRPSWLDGWLEWPSLTAVKSSNLYHIPPDFIQRHTVRILRGVQLMCSQINQSRENLKK